MTKKTRSIILFTCSLLFLLITPDIILYSLGYRVDFRHFKIVATGGIYVKAAPDNVTISIDSTAGNTTGFLSSYVFSQNLLPGIHTVIITKDGYTTYQKNLTVEENQVTKLEHVSLIKQNIPFSLLENNVAHFYITPDQQNALLTKITAKVISFETLNLQNNQKRALTLTLPGSDISNVMWSQDSTRALLTVDKNYYLLQPFLALPKLTALTSLTSTKNITFDPQNSSQIFYLKNKNIYSSLQINPLVKNVVAFQINSGDIVYLSYDGFLYDYDLENQTTAKLSSQVFALQTASTYTIKIVAQTTYLLQDQSLFTYNPASRLFESFYSPIHNIQISNDGQKILFSNDHEIFYTLTNKSPDFSSQKSTLFLDKSDENLGTPFWVGNDYIVFTSNDKVIISEIDTRGNINTVQLPKELPLTALTSIVTQNPTISFDQQNKKLYILTNGTLVASEKIIN